MFVKTFRSGEEASAAVEETVVEPSESAEVPSVEAAEKVEPVVEEKPAPQDDRFQRRFSELSKKEKELRLLKQEIEKEKAEISPLKEAIASAKDNPLSVLEKLGLNFADVADYVINKDEVPSQEEVLQKKIEKLEKWIESQEEAVKTSKQKEEESRIESSIREFKADIERTATGSKQEFELVNATQEYEMVFELVESYFKETGKVLSPKEALTQVESYLEKQLESHAKTEKFKKKYAFQEPAKASKPSLSQDKPLSSKTLTSAVHSSSGGSTGFDPYDAEASKQRAAEKLEKLLNRSQS